MAAWGKLIKHQKKLKTTKTERKKIKDELSNLNLEETDKTRLTEDMYQIKNGNLIIDAGWYEYNSSFIVFLVRNYDWENPIAKITSNNLKNCRMAIQFCIDYSNELK